MVFGLWENEKTGTACTLPKHARYQLRYIPEFYHERYYIKNLAQSQYLGQSYFFMFEKCKGDFEKS